MRTLAAYLLGLLFFSANIATASEAMAPGGPVSGADTAWLLSSSALVLLMTPGLSFFYGGMVRPKNVVSTMLQSFICMGLVSIFWYVCGFSLVFGDDIAGVFGNPSTYFMLKNVGEITHAVLSPTVPFILFALFQLKFAIITPALITGAFAERINFNAYLIFILLFEIFVYAPLAHMTWHPDGVLHKMGVLDFAGGTVVHMSAGVAALVGAYVLGSRRSPAGSENAHVPANVPYVLLGTGLLWFGWFGFNAGSSLSAGGLSAMAFATTHFASASAMVGWLAIDVLRGKKASAMGACVGAVVGLVAITPGAGYVSIGASIVIGFIGAAVSQAAVYWRVQSGLDDTLDVFPCHGVGGMVGMLLTGVFAKDGGLVAGQTHLFYAHVIAWAGVTLGVGLISYALYWSVDQFATLRVSTEEERVGLDLSQHNEVAVSHEEVFRPEAYQSFVASVAGNPPTMTMQ